MKTVKSVYEKQQHQSDKGGKHSYINEYYNPVFSPLHDEVKKVCEIGILKGSSMKLWYEFFESAEIHGVDKKLRWFEYDHKDYLDRCRLHIGRSDDANTWKNLPKNFDIIIDDGHHEYVTQADTFKIAWEHLKPGGIYVIEDPVDIDGDRSKFESLHPSCKIFDFRPNSNLFDDVIIQYIK
jgi:demethylmacrocin O-methyltransferase